METRSDEETKDCKAKAKAIACQGGENIGSSSKPTDKRSLGRG